MAAQLLEIEGTFRRQRVRVGEWIAAEIDSGGSPLVINGEADDEELSPGLRYRFYGRFAEYRGERQFKFQTFVPAQSHDRDGVIEYLVQAGKGFQLGRVTATKLWDEFGSDAVRVVRETPGELIRFNGRINHDQAKQIAEILKSRKATEDATIELTNLLAGRGLPKTTPRKAIKRWGNRAADVIRKDPYALMSFRGCGFKLCDSLWLELGHRPDRLKRQALCAWYSIASKSDGHTWFPIETVMEAVRQNIGATKARPLAAIKLATRLGRLAPDHYGALAGIKTVGAHGPISDAGDRAWIAEGKRASAERMLAELIGAAIAETRPASTSVYETHSITWEEAVTVCQCARCSRELTADDVHVWNGKPFGPTCIGYISDGTDVEVMPLSAWIEKQDPQVKSACFEIRTGKASLPSFSVWPDPFSIDGIDDHQRSKLADALISRVAILGGSPGTGKTYATAMLIRALLRGGLVGPEDIAIGAPTGKAAVRLTEALQAAGVQLRARTWHSLLGVGTSDEENGGWSFLHNENNPWKYRVIIGDESSMLDTALMRSVFAARPRGCHVLLVGDTNQLPPVGTGAPLRDLIASGCVGYGELTEIKRNSGGIVEACAAIRDSQPWEAGDNLWVWEKGNEKGQLERTLFMLERFRAHGFDPVWDCQVLVAVNARSPLSRKKVNECLQAELNANPRIAGTPFRVDDKIVCLKNGRYTVLDQDYESLADSEDDQIYVANGELGRVIKIEEKAIIAELSSPHRIIRIPRGKSSDKETGSEESSNSGCSWDLAYGLSCHKSQGSEWPVVIVLIDEYPGARLVCSREWIYTAISRAKSKVVLIGKKATADQMCRRVAIGKRKTFLRERLQLSVAEFALEGM